MTSACATITSNVPAQSEVFLKPVAVSCAGGAEIDFLYMKPFKRHLKLTTNG